MKVLAITAMMTVGFLSVAQDSIVSLDVLSAPQSPAANLMGFTDSEILKPESPTDFMANVKTASNGFSTVPNSLAMDFRLKNFIKPSYNNSYKDFVSIYDSVNRLNGVWNNIQQTAIVSLGYKNYSALNDSLMTGQGIGFGFKVSLCRGKFLDEKFKEKYDSLRTYQKDIGTKGAELQAAWKASSDYKYYKSQIKIADSLGKDADKQYYIEKYKEAFAEFEKKVNKENEKTYEKMKLIAQKLEFKSYGFVWDVAGGAVINFPTTSFDVREAGSSGIWTTLGWERPKGISFLFLARGLYTPDVTYTNPMGAVETTDIWNYDAGARFLYEHPGKSFSLSAEGIYRGAVNGAYDSKYRFTFNAGYEIYRNMKLTFMFGRDYDGNISRDGNVISALQLLAGFGSKKNLNR